MYKQFAALVPAALLSALACVSAAPNRQVLTAADSRNLSRSQLVFTENRGQVADNQGVLRPDILFTAHSGGAWVYLSANGIHYQFTKVDYPAGYAHDDRLMNDRGKQEALRQEIKYSTHRVTLSLAGANPAPVVRKEARQAYSEHFYLAHCPQGITGVHTYTRIVYEDIYPGIDWIIYSDSRPDLPDGKGSGGLKYDFMVHPGADPSLIRLVVTDAAGVRITDAGELLIETSLGEVRERAPESFCDGKKVATSFIETGAGIGFAVGDYDLRKDLRIDPSVVWATYYGGSLGDFGRGCATDASGSVYLTGYTTSAAGIAAAGYQVGLGGSSDAFLVKLDSSGNRLWATYYGGSGSDDAYACATDASGNVYCTGKTNGPGMATSGSFQPGFAGGSGNDAFMVKFNSAGTRLWGTYFGGTGDEAAYACATDKSGNVYLAGFTCSPSGIAYNGVQGSFGGGGPHTHDGLLVKFSAAGSRLWATYYGDSGYDDAFGCATDSAGNVYITGNTASASGIASANAHQAAFNGPTSSIGGDAFLAKFSGAGTRLWGTYFGGSASDRGFSCATDLSGNVFVSGATWSASGIATHGCFQSSFTFSGYENIFLVKFSGSGVRSWSTYYGGNSTNYALSCATDVAGNIFFGGVTQSVTGIASGGIQPSFNGWTDAFLVKLSSGGNRVWGSYYGGVDADFGSGCAADRFGNVFLCGWTSSSSGIAQHGFQNALSAYDDAFLVKIRDTVLPRIIIDSVIGGVFCAGGQMPIVWSANFTYNPNDISAQLSDSTGSFASPVTLPPVGPGLRLFQIPANTPPGTRYRVRMVCSVPALISPDNGFDMTILAVPAQPGPISGNTSACTGSGQVYSIAPVPFATSYNWSLPSGWSGSSSTTSITATVGSSGGTVSVTASNACGTSAPSTLAVIAGVNVLVTPTVSIPARSRVCTGMPATFTATVTNAGTKPMFQWKKNGVNVGTDSIAYTDASLATGDVITVVLISNASCAAPGAVTSNADTVTAFPSIIPGININTVPPIILCKGAPITFVTNNVGGGNTPAYQWYKNGIAIAGATAATYTDASLNNGDTLTVAMYSSATCPTTQPTISNRVGCAVYPVLVPQATITASPGTAIIPGQAVTFTAAPVNGGTAPEYLWYLNGVPVVYDLTGVWTTNNLKDGDVVQLRMESNAPCPVPALVYSNSLTIRSHAAGIGSLAALKGVQVYPNPVTDYVIIEGAQGGKVFLLSIIGQQISSGAIGSHKQRLDLSGLAAGTYMLVLTDQQGATGALRIARQ